MSNSARPDGGRAALAGFVTNRLGRNANRTAPARPAQRPAGDASVQNFESLPGYRELRLQRSAADLIGLGNPFFRVHETRAGATTRIDGRSFTNFSSYDYLGLNGHPRINEAARTAIDAFGTSASASRIVAGERPGHLSLEKALASHYGTEACVVMVSGHATNVTTIGALLEAGDVIFHDALSHNSIVTGAQLSGAQRRSFAHNDLDALESLLTATRHEHRRALIVIAEDLGSAIWTAAPAVVRPMARAPWLLRSISRSLPCGATSRTCTMVMRPFSRFLTRSVEPRGRTLLAAM